MLIWSLRLRARRTRAPRLAIRMIAIRTSAAPQAWAKPSGFASSDNWKIAPACSASRAERVERCALGEVPADEQHRRRLAGGTGDRAGSSR